MSHLAGRCSCGRRIHYPKHAQLGYRWTCRQCGKTWTLSTRGEPLHNQRSRSPPSAGCLQLILLVTISGSSLLILCLYLHLRSLSLPTRVEPVRMLESLPVRWNDQAVHGTAEDAVRLDAGM